MRPAMTEAGDLDCRCMCKDCEARTKETYRLTVHCPNCRWEGTALLRKGDRLGFIQSCPHCEVSGLVSDGSPDLAPRRLREGRG